MLGVISCANVASDPGCRSSAIPCGVSSSCCRILQKRKPCQTMAGSPSEKKKRRLQTPGVKAKRVSTAKEIMPDRGWVSKQKKKKEKRENSRCRGPSPKGYHQKAPQNHAELCCSVPDIVLVELLSRRDAAVFNCLGRRGTGAYNL